MRKTLALSAVIGLAGCEYDVREKPLGRDYDPPYEPAPVPVPSSSSSSQPKMPASSTSDASVSDEDASAAPAYECTGTPVPCGDLDLATCGYHRGCSESLSDGKCIGSPTPCSWLGSQFNCENHMGCSWTQPPPR